MCQLFHHPFYPGCLEKHCFTIISTGKPVATGGLTLCLLALRHTIHYTIRRSSVPETKLWKGNAGVLGLISSPVDHPALAR